MNKKGKYLLWIAVAAIVAAAGWIVWSKTASPTKIALVNFQPFQVSNMALSNDDPFIRYASLATEEVDKWKDYDLVLGFGMGLKLSAEQRGHIQKLIDKGLPVYIFAATSPENHINSLDSVDLEQISGYLNNGNKNNYRNFARYVRKHIDKKSFFVTPPEPVAESIEDAFFHLDEEVSFTSAGDYETYLKKLGQYKDGAGKVAVIAGIHDPFSGNKEHLDSLIVSLQNAGLNVYPFSSMTKRIEFLDQIHPDAVIYFPHGRLLMGQPDKTVEWLQARNIPVFTPLTILQLREDWMKDPMGMFGGFMGQSVVMPELDGAIYPYTLVAQEKNSDGVYLFRTIPDRLRSFTQIVKNVLSLKHKKNAEKKVAIYYFKGAGQETLAAQGLETIPSLYNLLKRLKAEGYTVDRLPATVKEFEALLMKQGSVLSTYAEGAFDEFLKNGNPQLVGKEEYEEWVRRSLSPESYKAVTDVYGEAPGAYMALNKDGKEYLAVARVQFGNVVLLPQPMAALGDDSFAIVHGAKSPPPHTYIGSYLWTQYGFGADALIHFGTHGSLEFTPQKQVALSSNDWADRLVGTIPHFYYYTIGNVGESMIAKRRSYATTVSYLTPAFMESNTRSQFNALQDKIRDYYKSQDSPARTKETEQTQASLSIKKITVQMGIHRDLRLDSILSKPYTEEEIERIDNYAEEIANEKMNGQLYVSGVPYSPEKIKSTVLAMSADPIAYSLASLDKQRGKITDKQLQSKPFFTRRYLEPAKTLVHQVLAGKPADEQLVCRIAGITSQELEESRAALSPVKRGMPGRAQHKPEKKEYTKEQKEHARAVLEIERTIRNITRYEQALRESPELEFKALINALSGGYTAPSSGGDAVANPSAVPTGRNLYSINAESTPSELAWDRGVALVNTTLEAYKKQHGEYPRKISYTFWSSEFIETEGTSIAQVLYMLGVEPIRDTYGRVTELRLIPAKELGRPRIDVVVQTSGQFRDLAASRLMLISKAVEMAAAAKDDGYDNLVSASTVEIERLLVEQGVAPKDAREMSTQRVFGGINGMYGTGIQEMITAGDRWEDEKEVADTYIHNMGAAYGSDKNWGQFNEGLLRAALHNTDVVVQPRQNNTWGPLSLDHVYEFMGGINLAVRSVTGKDPDAYLADYRNHNNMKMQELKEAIGVESRATVLNPSYVREVMSGGAESAAKITEVVTNTYGWNVTKPDVIDNELWDELYSMYVEDTRNLGTKEFFRRENPGALQEITAVMMETARKGMWKATDRQLTNIAGLHSQLVKEYGSTGSGFAGGNAKLQDFIAGKLSAQDAQAYNRQITAMNTAASSSQSGQSGMVLQKQQVQQGDDAGETKSLNSIWIVLAVLIIFTALLVILRKKRRK